MSEIYHIVRTVRNIPHFPDALLISAHYLMFGYGPAPLAAVARARRARFTGNGEDHLGAEDSTIRLPGPSAPFEHVGACHDPPRDDSAPCHATPSAPFPALATIIARPRRVIHPPPQRRHGEPGPLIACLNEMWRPVQRYTPTVSKGSAGWPTASEGTCILIRRNQARPRCQSAFSSTVVRCGLRIPFSQPRQNSRRCLTMPKTMPTPCIDTL